MNSWPDHLAPFLAWLGRNSLQACLLVVVLLALQALLRDRVSPRWRYALWLILVVKLTLPWSPPSRLSMYNILSSLSPGAAPVAVDIDAAAAESPAPSSVAPSASELPAVSATAAEPLVVAPAAAEPPLSGPSPDEPTLRQRLCASLTWPTLMELLPIVWLAGALPVAIATVLQAIRLGAIRRHRVVTDQATLDLLEDCKQQMDVPAYLAVVETPHVSSPALFGFLRPRLLLPPGAIADLGPHRLRHVFLHELAHLKRHDIPVNWLLALLQTLHWFNPLVWYAFAWMRSERELACDALALSRAGALDPRDYGRTIVDLLETFVQPQRQPNLAGVLEDKSQLKRRITMIAQFRKGSHSRSLPIAALFVLLGAVALTNAQTQQPAPTPPTTQELIRTARQVATDMAEGNFARATQRFDAKMKMALSPKDLQAAWDGVVREAGPFQEQLGTRAEQFGPYKFIFVTCRFQQGPVDVKVVFDKDGLITGLFLQPAPIPPAAPASQPSAISFTDQDLRVLPYKEGDQFVAIAAVHNNSSQPSGQYEVRFYRGQPKRGNEAGPPGAGGVGPIEPNGTWREGSMPFALRDGTHAITAVLTPAGSEETAAGLRATVVVTVRDGKIVSQTPGAGGGEGSAATVPFRYENVTIQPYPEGGLFIVRVKLRNTGDSVTPRCTLRYFRGDPRNAVPAGPDVVTNIDTMQPGGKSDSSSPPFALSEGSNVITCVLRPVDAPPAAPSQIVSVRVTVKDGKIVSQEPVDAPQSQPAAAGETIPSDTPLLQAVIQRNPSLPENTALASVACVDSATGKPVEGAKVQFERWATRHLSGEEKEQGREAASTRADGIARFQLRPDRYEVGISSPSGFFATSTRDYTVSGGSELDLRLACPTNGGKDAIGYVSFEINPKLDVPGTHLVLRVLLGQIEPELPASGRSLWWYTGPNTAELTLQGLVLGRHSGYDIPNVLFLTPQLIAKPQPSLSLPAGRCGVGGFMLYAITPQWRKTLEAGTDQTGYVDTYSIGTYLFTGGKELDFTIRPGDTTTLRIDLPPQFLKIIKDEIAAQGALTAAQAARTAMIEAGKLSGEKEYSKAIAAHQQFIDRYPYSGFAKDAQMMIGICYDNLGQTDKAIAAFERAIRQYPHEDLAATYFHLGSAYERANRFDDALAAYQESLRRANRIGRGNAFPRREATARIETIKAQKLFEKKDFAEAIAAFQKVVDGGPHSSDTENAQMMIGICYDHLGQNDKAIAAFERAVKEHPREDLAATYYYLGSAYERAERFDDAVAAYRQSLQRAERIGRGSTFPGGDAKARIEALKTRATSSNAQ